MRRPPPPSPAPRPPHAVRLRPRRPRTAAAGQPSPAAAIVERPDGYHGTDDGARQESGPFAPAIDAVEDRLGEGMRAAQDIQALPQAQPRIDFGRDADEPGGDSSAATP